MQRKPRPAWAKLGAIALALLAFAAAWRFTPLADFVRPQRVIGFARAIGDAPWAPFAVAAAYIPAAFILFPRPLLTLLAVVAFGLWLGFACTVAGVLAAALVSYYVGRRVSERTVRRLAGAKFERICRVVREHGIAAIFAANMLPTPPFVVQGIMAGAIRVKVWQYALGTFLSLLPGLAAAMVFGHQIVTAFDDSTKVSYSLIGGTLLALLAIGVVSGRWFSRQARG